jgi:alpha-ribazole phosphatase
LWLVRHARTLIDPGVCYGALDVAADPEATREAAQVLAQCLPPDLQVISSPLQRCELLAQVLYGLRPDLMYKTDSRLAEMDFGCWEGQRWDSIPQPAYEAWTTDFWRHHFGGAENLADFMTRVAQAWNDAQQAKRSTGAAQVWITHAGVSRAVSLIAKGVFEVQDAALWPTDAPSFGQWHRVGPAQFERNLQES